MAAGAFFEMMALAARRELGGGVRQHLGNDWVEQGVAPRARAYGQQLRSSLSLLAIANNSQNRCIGRACRRSHAKYTAKSLLGTGRPRQRRKSVEVVVRNKPSCEGSAFGR